MIKLLVYNDPHFSIVPPSSRTSSYPSDVLKKISEAFSIARKANCNYVASTGDNFHRKEKTNHLETRLMIKVRKECPVEFIGVGGNHDMTGFNLNSRKSKALGVLEEAGTIRLLDFKPIIKNGILITGTSHNNSYDKERLAYFKTPEQMKYFTVAITHGSLVLSKNGKFWGNYTNMSHLEEHKDAIPHNIIINGHLHHPQEEYVSEERNFSCFAVGSLTRNILKEDVAKRIPKVLLIKIKDGDYEFEEIELKSAKKASEVFINIDASKSIDDNKIAEFVQSLLEESNDMNIQTNKHLIKRIIKKRQYPKEIEIKVLNYLENRGCYDSTC